MIGPDKLNILIVGHYFPPFNTPRSFRTFELGRELARQGHNVTFRILKGNHDYSNIENERLKVLSIGKSQLGNVDSAGDYSKNWILRGLAKYLVSYEFPSIELMFLVQRSIKNVTDYDLIISIAYPYPIHWGVGKLIQKLPQGKRPLWISDCGDPYTGNPMAHFFKGFKHVEKWWGNLTDYITIPIESARNAYFPEVRSKIRVIPQGFNFSETKIEEYMPHDIPTFIYAGMIYEGTRDPGKFIDYLIDKNMDFRFIIYTREKKFFNKYNSILGNKIILHDYIDRLDLIREMSKADFLVNIVNTGIVQAPSKLIDYALSKRPIFNISTDFNEGPTADQFLHRDYSKRFIPKDIEQFDIKNIAAKFLDVYYTHKKNIIPK